MQIVPFSSLISRTVSTFMLRRDQAGHARVAQWQRAGLLPRRRPARPAAGRQPLPQPPGRDRQLMGLHRLGMPVPVRAGRAARRGRVLRSGGLLPLPGVPLFRTEPLLLGLAGQLPGDHLLREPVVTKKPKPQIG